MSFTVGDVMEAARELHEAFGVETTPDATLRRHLSRYQRTLLLKVVERDPTLVTTEDVVDLPADDDWEGGIALPDHLYVHGVVAFDTSTPSVSLPVDLIPFAHRFDAGPLRAAWITGGVLYLRGRHADWSASVGQIGVSYVPVPEPFDDDDTDSVLPDTAQPAMVEQAGLFLARRALGRPGFAADLTTFAAMAQAAEGEFLNGISMRLGAQVVRIRDVRSH